MQESLCGIFRRPSARRPTNDTLFYTPRQVRIIVEHGCANIRGGTKNRGSSVDKYELSLRKILGETKEYESSFWLNYERKTITTEYQEIKVTIELDPEITKWDWLAGLLTYSSAAITFGIIAILVSSPERGEPIVTGYLTRFAVGCVVGVVLSVWQSNRILPRILKKKVVPQIVEQLPNGCIEGGFVTIGSFEKQDSAGNRIPSAPFAALWGTRID
jgi:hypothetical protein